jgi:hypothetical protein
MSSDEDRTALVTGDGRLWKRRKFGVAPPSHQAQGDVVSQNAIDHAFLTAATATDTTQYLQRGGSDPGKDWVLMVRSGVVNSNAAGGRLVEDCVAQQPRLRVLILHQQDD